MEFRVYDLDGNDVTDSRQFFISADGSLYVYDDTLCCVDDDYWYSQSF